MCAMIRQFIPRRILLLYRAIHQWMELWQCKKTIFNVIFINWDTLRWIFPQNASDTLQYQMECLISNGRWMKVFNRAWRGDDLMKYLRTLGMGYVLLLILILLYGMTSRYLFTSFLVDRLPLPDGRLQSLDFALLTLVQYVFIALSLLIPSVSKQDRIIKTLMVLCVLILSPILLSNWFTTTHAGPAQLTIFRNAFSRQIYPAALFFIIAQCALLFENKWLTHQVCVFLVIAGSFIFIAFRLYCLFTVSTSNYVWEDYIQTFVFRLKLLQCSLAVSSGLWFSTLLKMGLKGRLLSSAGILMTLFVYAGLFFYRQQGAIGDNTLNYEMLTVYLPVLIILITGNLLAVFPFQKKEAYTS